MMRARPIDTLPPDPNSPIQVSVTTDPDTEVLARAFGANSYRHSGGIDGALDLRISVSDFSEQETDLWAGSQHFRSGDRHFWQAEMPRQQQELQLGPPSRAWLEVTSSSITDGGILARPAVDSISAWAAANSTTPVHASGAAIGGQGILFLGEGGAGKTTTALAMALRGWSLIADDRCFVNEAGRRTTVSGLYHTAILTEHTASLLGGSLGAHLGETHQGKLAFQLPEEWAVGKSLQLCAVVCLDQSDGEPYQLRPVPIRQSLLIWQQSLTPAIQAVGPSRDWLGALTRLTRHVPVFSMTLGWDWDRMSSTLMNLINREKH